MKCVAIDIHLYQMETFILFIVSNPDSDISHFQFVVIFSVFVSVVGLSETVWGIVKKIPSYEIQNDICSKCTFPVFVGSYHCFNNVACYLKSTWMKKKNEVKTTKHGTRRLFHSRVLFFHLPSMVSSLFPFLSDKQNTRKSNTLSLK